MEGPAPGPCTMLRGNANFHPSAGKSPGRSVTELFRATSGSAGLDLNSSTYAVLTPEMGIQALPTGVWGPLPSGTLGLLLGRNSTTMQGIIVHPGIINADYTGEIKIMTGSPSKISAIQAGQRIAQLIILPANPIGHAKSSKLRGTQGFGSSDLYWIQAIGQKRPELKLKIRGKEFLGLLDTGADVSVIALQHWPQQWPKQPTMTVTGNRAANHS